jgi:hypothetical protein
VPRVTASIWAYGQPPLPAGFLSTLLALQGRGAAAWPALLPRLPDRLSVGAAGPIASAGRRHDDGSALAGVLRQLRDDARDISIEEATKLRILAQALRDLAMVAHIEDERKRKASKPAKQGGLSEEASAYVQRVLFGGDWIEPAGESNAASNPLSTSCWKE